ncbi:hypothetical protein [Nonomuraea sp. NPDC049480]|uniref:hypothetical protein n=1 Tax=Nonomuraea sp. NPDC049480 TaxID=3364353 RepID=UPI0037A5BF0D
MSPLLRDTLQDWAGEARVPHDLADRALRRRAWWKPVGVGMLVVGLVAAVAVVVTGQGIPEVTVRPANGVTLPARPSPAPTDVRSDTENSPPAKFIAAGNMAMSAYYTIQREQIAEDRQRIRYIWSLYDPRIDGYERTSWAWVDVAPGLQVAAVLDGDLISKRLGILDMNTRQILKWFDLEHPVASVSWSPDGKKVLATAYSEYPDVEAGSGKHTSPAGTSPRTGYYIVDVESGEVGYHALPPLKDDVGDGRPFNMNSRQDIGWSVDGAMLWAPTGMANGPKRLFYSLDGKERAAPADQRYAEFSGISAISPNGRLVLGPSGLPTAITDRETGEIVGRQNVMQLHAWADDDNVLAIGCAGSCENEFNGALVLVSVDGKRMTQLGAYFDNRKEGAWGWVLTPR